MEFTGPRVAVDDLHPDLRVVRIEKNDAQGGVFPDCLQLGEGGVQLLLRIPVLPDRQADPTGIGEGAKGEEGTTGDDSGDAAGHG